MQHFVCKMRNRCGIDVLLVPAPREQTISALLAPCFGSMFTILGFCLINGQTRHTFTTPTHTHRAQQSHIFEHALNLSSSSCRWSSEMQCPFFTWHWASQPNFYISVKPEHVSPTTHLVCPIRLSVSQYVHLLVCLSIL